jgi:sigma-B regulation protein RsbU (phosphoserine phosphatase)
MQSLKASRLEALLESAHLLHASLDLDDLLRHLLRSVMGRLVVSRACIAVSEGGAMRVALSRGLQAIRPGEPFDEAVARGAGLEFLLPIGAPDDPVGLLAIGRPVAGELDDAEQEFVRGLLGLAASGIANARAHRETERLNQQLGEKVQELRTLLDLVRGFAATQDPESVARLLALTLSGRWAVTRYAVAAWKTGHAPVVRERGVHLPSLERFDPVLPSLPDAVTVSALPRGEFRDTLRSQGVELVFPIRSAAGVRGLIALGARGGQVAYDETGYEFGSALVAQAAVAFENAWHFQEVLERKKVEQELQLAASIQQALFPASMPQLTGYELASYTRPARQVGGDYYDALPIPATGPPSACLFCVADVSGKGLPASLLMSTIQATLRALHGSTLSLGELATRTGELLYATTPENKYATAILAHVEAGTGAGSYVNAGHTSAMLLRSNGEMRALDATGTPLGLLPGMIYTQETFEFGRGDLLALYSDGVTEAFNVRDEEFGEQRLADVLRAARDQPVDHAVAGVRDAIERFVAGAPQSDDITLLLLRRTR